MVKVLSRLSGGKEIDFPNLQTGVKELSPSGWITAHNNECAIQYERDFPYPQAGGESDFPPLQTGGDFFFFKFFITFCLRTEAKVRSHQVNSYPHIRLRSNIELRVFSRWKLVSGSHFVVSGLLLLKCKNKESETSVTYYCIAIIVIMRNDQLYPLNTAGHFVLRYPN